MRKMTGLSNIEIIVFDTLIALAFVNHSECGLIILCYQNVILILFVYLHPILTNRSIDVVGSKLSSLGF